MGYKNVYFLRIVYSTFLTIQYQISYPFASNLPSKLNSGLKFLISFIFTRLGQFFIGNHFIFQTNQHSFKSTILVPVFQSAALCGVNLLISNYFSSLFLISYLAVGLYAWYVNFINKSDFRGNLGIIRSASDLQRVYSTVEVCLLIIIILTLSHFIRYKVPK